MCSFIPVFFVGVIHLFVTSVFPTHSSHYLLTGVFSQQLLTLCAFVKGYKGELSYD